MLHRVTHQSPQPSPCPLNPASGGIAAGETSASSSRRKIVHRESILTSPEMGIGVAEDLIGDIMPPTVVGDGDRRHGNKRQGMIAAANAAVPRLQPDEVRKMMGTADVVIVDVRDPPEVHASGKIKGAVAVSRGMLEFRADPDLPSHNPAFTKDKRIVRMRYRRSLRLGREDLSGDGLQIGVQWRWVQGTGRCRIGHRACIGRRASTSAIRNSVPVRFRNVRGDRSAGD